MNDGANQFNVGSNAFAPPHPRRSSPPVGCHLEDPACQRLERLGGGYRLPDPKRRRASQSGPAAGRSGRRRHRDPRDGTGWNTFEVQTTYTPPAGDFGNGRHALVLGLHRNQYQLQNVVNNAPDWRGAETTLDPNYCGKTTITAVVRRTPGR